MIFSLMIIVFIFGYTLIALEYKTQVNKSAVSILLSVLLWILYVTNSESFVTTLRPMELAEYVKLHPVLHDASFSDQVLDYVINGLFVTHIGETAEIIIFLMGAMTVVEIIDTYGGFNFVNNIIHTRSSKKLIWIIMVITFFLSSVLDNLTTSIVMIMILRKLVKDQTVRWMYAGIIIVAANAGGAFSPIGDVTTILLWIHGNVSTLGIIKVTFIPAIVSVAIPTLIVSFLLKGEVLLPESIEDVHSHQQMSNTERVVVFLLGFFGLISVPIFKSLTGLPPLMGVMAVLGIIWFYTELLYRHKLDVEEDIKQRVSKIIKHIDMATVLFLFGILLSVAALQEAGILDAASKFLDKEVHNVYGMNLLIGFLSSVVDNGSLVAGVIGMYPKMTAPEVAASLDPAYFSSFLVDGEFWNLLAYCAGVGGSLMIIGSAAGVMVMGLERITFAWYFKHFSWIVLVGYLSGIACFYLQAILFDLV